MLLILEEFNVNLFLSFCKLRVIALVCVSVFDVTITIGYSPVARSTRFYEGGENTTISKNLNENVRSLQTKIVSSLFLRHG